MTPAMTKKLEKMGVVITEAYDEIFSHPSFENYSFFKIQGLKEECVARQVEELRSNFDKNYKWMSLKLFSDAVAKTFSDPVTRRMLHEVLHDLELKHVRNSSQCSENTMEKGV